MADKYTPYTEKLKHVLVLDDLPSMYKYEIVRRNKRVKMFFLVVQTSNGSLFSQALEKPRRTILGRPRYIKNLWQVDKASIYRALLEIETKILLNKQNVELWSQGND